jgi:transposase InsO family protein
MTLEDSIHGLRLRALRRAHELGSVTAACHELGISRPLFYRWRRRLEQFGPDGLHPSRQRGRAGRPPQIAPHDERLILGWAVAWPTWGPRRLARQLVPQGVVVAPSTVYRLLIRSGLRTRRERLAVLEHHSAREAGLLTARTRRRLWEARHGRTRHVEAAQPGELVCLDTFYVGKLKGVGPVWQLTACDAACSYGLARLVPKPDAAAAAMFLRDVVVPVYRAAGWPLARVLTDGGAEFKGVFDHVCAALQVRHTRTQPRHAWTNGFVERLQRTILHEHWRVVFRRYYFTRLTTLQQSLASFMRFYNTLRPHQGYRLAGRTPASVFWRPQPSERARRLHQPQPARAANE